MGGGGLLLEGGWLFLVVVEVGGEVGWCCWKVFVGGRLLLEGLESCSCCESGRLLLEGGRLLLLLLLLLLLKSVKKLFGL